MYKVEYGERKGAGHVGRLGIDRRSIQYHSDGFLHYLCHLRSVITLCNRMDADKFICH